MNFIENSNIREDNAVGVRKFEYVGTQAKKRVRNNIKPTFFSLARPLKQATCRKL